MDLVHEKALQEQLEAEEQRERLFFNLRSGKSPKFISLSHKFPPEPRPDIRLEPLQNPLDAPSYSPAQKAEYHRHNKVLISQACESEASLVFVVEE
jgi:hypothetical protein